MNSKTLGIIAVVIVAVVIIFFATREEKVEEPEVVVAPDAELVFPSLSYRTGPYAPNGIPFADGYADYFTLLNERDGGIGGVPIRFIECETGYNTEKGVECYESTKGEGALVYQPLSTGITYQLIPKATADGIFSWRPTSDVV